MIKLKLFLMLFLCFLIAATSLFAGSLDHLSNRSARYIVVPSRNAATDAADIVAYNPAGTAFLSQGFHVDLSSQSFFKYYSEDVNFAAINFHKELKQDEPTPSLPNLYLVYNFGQMGPGKLAAYLEIGVSAGGGNLNWKNGTAGTTLALFGIGTDSTLGIGPADSQSFKASSMYLTSGIGASYSLMDDMVAVSLGGRVMRGIRSFELGATFGGGETLNGEYEYNATGFTPIIGFDVKPIDGLILSARYEYETEFEFKYEQKKLEATGNANLEGVAADALANAGIADGNKFKQHLPHLIGLGAEYKINNDFLITASSAIYLLSKADLAGIEKHLGTGWEIGLGAKYNVSKELQLGWGVLYTETGAKDSFLNSSSTLLNVSANAFMDSIALNFGGTYALENLGLDFTLGFMYTHYLSEDYSVDVGPLNISGKYRKDVYVIAFGVGYHM